MSEVFWLLHDEPQIILSVGVGEVKGKSELLNIIFGTDFGLDNID